MVGVDGPHEGTIYAYIKVKLRKNCLDMNMFARFDEIPTMTLQDILRQKKILYVALWKIPLVLNALSSLVLVYVYFGCFSLYV